MFANFFEWTDDPAEWARQAWREVVDFGQAVFDGATKDLGEAASIVIGLVLLYYLLPHLAHLAVLLLMWLLGAPAWFIAALLFGQVH